MKDLKDDSDDSSSNVLAAATPAELRAAFKARYKEHGLQDPRVKALERWIAKVDDDRVAEAIEMVSIAMDAPRHGRWEVSRIIDDELRKPELIFPHEDRMTFLRWIVRSRETSAKIEAKLKEIRDAKSTKERAKVIASLDPTNASASTGAEEEEAATSGASGSLENAHTVLAHAWKSAPANARPKHDAHHGEAEAFIGALGTIRAAVWMARYVEHLLGKGEKTRFATMLKHAEAAADGKPVSEALKNAAKETKLTGALGMARSACAEAKATRGRPDMAGSATRPAVVKVVALLLEKEGRESVRKFLSALDEELRRLDIVHAAHLKKKSPTSPIARAVYRGTGVWVAELEDGRFALLSKQGARWVWSEGEKKEILATVPDIHFEKAVMAAK